MFKPELLSPAGDLSKMRTAYTFGADAVYMGLEGFSLRTRSNSLSKNNLGAYREIKKQFPGRRLYLAINRYFHEADLKRLDAYFELLADLEPDGLIVSDLGAFYKLKNEFPRATFHLSTQANTLNSDAVKFYEAAGFSRVILGRECSFSELEALREAVPQMELEIFVHGAQCMAISGRCYLSAAMAKRSANEGDCAHSCRWNYRLRASAGDASSDTEELFLEEEKRPGILYPVQEDQGYTSIFSAKDLSLIDYLDEIKNLGINSLKIEGRMKSEYYVAAVTRTYRKVLDGVGPQEKEVLKRDLESFSHREYGTGFFFGPDDASEIQNVSYKASHIYAGRLVKELAPDPAHLALLKDTGSKWHRYELDVRNNFTLDQELEIFGFETERLASLSFLVGLNGRIIDKAKPGQYTELYTPQSFNPDFILRLPNPSYEP